MKQVEPNLQELQENDSKSMAILMTYKDSFDSLSSFRDFVSLIHNCYLEASRTIDYIDNLGKTLCKEEKDDFYRTQREFWKNEAQSYSQLFPFSSASLNDIAKVLLVWKDDSDMLRIASNAAITRIILEMIRKKLLLKKAVRKGGRKEDNKCFKNYVANGVDAEKVSKYLHDVIDDLNDEKQAMCVIVAACRSGALVDHPSSTMILSEFPVIKEKRTVTRYLDKLPDKWENMCEKYKSTILSIME